MGTWNWDRKTPLWSFVIDTNAYAGNFERELSAYVIGRCDDFGEGMDPVQPYINLYRTECGKLLEDLVDCRVNDPGDDGLCRAPMDLAPTPGQKKHTFNSVAIFMKHKPSKKQLALLVERAMKFPSLPPLSFNDKGDLSRHLSLNVIGCRLVEEYTRIVSHKVKP